jgi:hypothetical protein
MNKGTVKYTAKTLIAANADQGGPEFEVYCGDKKADCRRAFMTDYELQIDKINIFAVFC